MKGTLTSWERCLKPVSFYKLFFNVGTGCEVTVCNAPAGRWPTKTLPAKLDLAKTIYCSVSCGELKSGVLFCF